MQHPTKVVRLTLLNEQVDALAELGKSNHLSLSQTLIQLLQTTTLNAQYGKPKNIQSNTASHQHIDGGLPA